MGRLLDQLIRETTNVEQKLGKQRNGLNNLQIFNLMNWVKANKAIISASFYTEVSPRASEELGFPVSAGQLSRACADLGIAGKVHTKPRNLEADRDYAMMQNRIRLVGRSLVELYEALDMKGEKLDQLRRAFPLQSS